MASAATDVAETRAQLSQPAAWLGSAQGNANYSDETPSRSVGTNPRGSHVGPHHTGHTVAVMVDRRDIEIILNDLDDPNVPDAVEEATEEPTKEPAMEDTHEDAKSGVRTIRHGKPKVPVRRAQSRAVRHLGGLLTRHRSP